MKHILIAEDDIRVANLIGRILPDYKVSTAHNGLEALAVAAGLPSCDLLITDYLMPGLMGDQLVERLRQQHPEVKTLVLSAFGALVDIGQCRPDDTLAKPFNAVVLRERVSQLIGHA
jgi:CheY-like chemotaxis protein